MKPLFHRQIILQLFFLFQSGISFSQNTVYPVFQRDFFPNKIIPPALEAECLTALLHFPELENTHIIFRFGKASTTMSSRPALGSLIHHKNKRTYIVTINEAGAAKLGLQWNELNFNETVCWLGHELGHVLHYTRKSNAGILWMGYKYSFARYKRKMERFTDQIAIDHNLGFALYDGIEFTLNCSNATRKYKNHSRRFYLRPKEILQKTYAKAELVPNYRKTAFYNKSEILQHMK